MSFGTRKRPRLVTGLVAITAAATVGLTGCDALDSITGDPEMQWVGKDSLAKEPKTAPVYRATAALPALTPQTAATALGHSIEAASLSEANTVLTGERWKVLVKQSPYVTTLKYQRDCGDLSADPRHGAASGGAFLKSLDLDPSDWTWMTFTGADRGARVIAEPNIDDTQTWGTGNVSILADDKGVCVATASLMAFAETNQTRTLDSAYETFQSARHDERLSIAGEYDQAALTWTLASEGNVVPLWHYSATNGDGIVAVDLGEGLETAPDTQTFLRQAAAPLVESTGPETDDPYSTP